MERPKAPEPAETPEDAPTALVADLARMLGERHGLTNLIVGAKIGARAAFVKCAFGPRERTVEIELFIRDVDDPGIDGGLAVLVDFLDDVVGQHLSAGGDAWLPLDWTTHPIGQHQVFGRMELHNLDAEEKADQILAGD